MNIKSIASQIFSFPLKEKSKTRTESNPERDANAQYENSGQQTPDRHMSDQELEAVIANIKAIKGVQDNGWIVRVAKDDGVTRIFVETVDGTVIRRIPEKDLWSVLKTKDKTTGNLLNKIT